MSCNCNDPAHARDPSHKPCTPCAQAAAAIARATPPVFMGAAQDDLTTIQQLLQEMSSGVGPTDAQLAAAKQAASNLSVDLALPNSTGNQTSKLPVTPIAMTMIIIGAALGGATLTYVLTTKPKKRKR